MMGVVVVVVNLYTKAIAKFQKASDQLAKI